jgi:hypothetical protein
MKKIVLTFGLIAGALMGGFLSLGFLIPGAHSFENGEIYGYASMVLALLLIYFGVRQYRDTVAGGTVRFWKACQVGISIFLVAGLCYALTWEVLYRTVASDFMAEYSAFAIERARAGGATEAELAAQQAEMSKFAVMYANPFIRLAFSFLEPLPVGLIAALASAGILSRKKREEGGEAVPA